MKLYLQILFLCALLVALIMPPFIWLIGKVDEQRRAIHKPTQTQ